MTQPRTPSMKRRTKQRATYGQRKTKHIQKQTKQQNNHNHHKKKATTGLTVCITNAPKEEGKTPNPKATAHHPTAPANQGTHTKPKQNTSAVTDAGTNAMKGDTKGRRRYGQRKGHTHTKSN